MSPTYLIKINSTTINKIKEYKVQRNKLWTDAGRNLAGNLRASFIGIFPKVIITLSPLNNTEMEAITTLLDNSSFTLEWWDVKSQSYKTGTYYAGDFDSSMIKKTNDGLYEVFNVSLIPFNKYT